MPSRHVVESPVAVSGRNASIYRERLPNARFSVIARAGFDVAASCGMFFEPEGAGAGGVGEGVSPVGGEQAIR